ncbi:ATP-binding protein [Propionivibrio dicarboxylicus]|uniref:histidine kinase n=1 Tax=Propionivibrio dicarboxylicus TaxID=83767 RepID=A0A1G8BG32_9RHOO|nr:ATP-binding protein [Propionivibrio dicarboxylicus]SDH32205.1 hemerythrin-like metal-binding domain protein [Propionivibrio dicarboxylicus]
MTATTQSLELFAWNDRFLTGVDLIDDEHQRLVHLINRVATLHGTSADSAEARAMLEELIAFTGEHFSHEEQVMDGVCDTRFVMQHKVLHRKFLWELEKIRLSDSSSSAIEYLLRFLSSWLAYHILGIDQSVGRQLRKIAGGMSPARAFEEEKSHVSDPATSSLLNAMQNLTGIISQRNQQLTELTTQLEATVRERTAKLTHAVHDLRLRNEELLTLNKQLAEVRQQLLQAEKLASIGSLAAGVAHEINNPIGFVKSNLGQLASSLKALLAAIERDGVQLKGIDLESLQEDIPELIRESQDGITRVVRIADDLRSFAQIQESGVPGWTRLSVLMDGVARLHPALVSGRVTLARNDSAPVEIRCVSAEIADVVSAIINNAVDAITHDRGRIILRTGSGTDDAWMEIEDNGKGIPPDYIHKIFDPFFTTKEVGAGTGMGLARAYGIVRKHGGRIEVRSSPGSGTVFRVTLPRGE